MQSSVSFKRKLNNYSNGSREGEHYQVCKHSKLSSGFICYSLYHHNDKSFCRLYHNTILIIYHYIWEFRLKGIRSVAVCVHSKFGQFYFVSNVVETYCTENAHGITCTDGIVTAMNEAINTDSVDQHHQTFIINIFQLV